MNSWRPTDIIVGLKLRKSTVLILALENINKSFKRHRKKDFVLNLRPKEIVEVLSESEILSTLDENGTLKGLPFIPEMHVYCGKRFRVLERVSKTIVEHGVGMRRMKNTVILEGVTCDGEEHGGCRRTCPLFWKEAWLKRTQNNLRKSPLITNSMHLPTNSVGSKDEVFSCQSTNLIKATSRLPAWDIRQYIWDIGSGRFKPIERMHELLISFNSKVQQILGGKRYAAFHGKYRRTPTISLNLQPEELVEVRSKEEILSTLDSKGRNRGLEFTAEMLKFCGKRYRVLKRFDKMINEKTGKMRQIANSVILERVTCDGRAHGGCQRNCYCFWREIWLKKVQ